MGSSLSCNDDQVAGSLLKTLEETVQMIFGCNRKKALNVKDKNEKNGNKSKSQTQCSIEPIQDQKPIARNTTCKASTIDYNNVPQPITNLNNCCEHSWHDSILKNVGTMEEELKKYDTQRDELKEAQKKIKEELKLYDRQKEKLQKRLECFEHNLNDNKQYYDQLMQDFEKIQAQLKQYDECRNELAQRYVDMRNDLCESEEYNNYYTENLEKLREELTSVDKCRTCLQENNDKLLFEIAKYEQYRDYIKQIHDKTKDELKQLTESPKCETPKSNDCDVKEECKDLELIKDMIRNEYCKIMKEMEKIIRCGYKCPEINENPQCQDKKQLVIECYRDHPHDPIACQDKVREFVESVVLAKCLNKEKQKK